MPASERHSTLGDQGRSCESPDESGRRRRSAARPELDHVSLLGDDRASRRPDAGNGLIVEMREALHFQRHRHVEHGEQWVSDLVC